MRVTKALFFSLFAAVLTSANPVQNLDGLQTILTGTPEQVQFLGDVFGEIVEGVERIVEESKKLFSDASETVDRWVHDGREYIKQHDQICPILHTFSDYLRTYTLLLR